MKLQRQTAKNKNYFAMVLAVLLLTMPLIAAAQGKIAFASNRSGFGEIYVMNADGTNQTQLTFGNTQNSVEPDLSPDGTKIVFASTMQSHDHEILIMNVDGTNLTRLTNNPANDRLPKFPPTARRSCSFQTGTRCLIEPTYTL